MRLAVPLLAALLLSSPLGAQRRTYAVTVIDSAQLHSVPAGTPIAALVGKVPGGRVVASSNDPGTSPMIYLRGAMASMEGEPLIVIDGVPSLLDLADITSTDVARIEIVNGAAGGATYGMRGGNGVVYITTRHAQRAASPWLVARSDVGQTNVPRRLPTSLRHAYQLDANGNFVLGTGGSRVGEPDGIQDNSYLAYYDLAGAVLRPRNVFSNYLGGGRDFWSGRTRVAASGSDDHDHGVLAVLNGYSRSTARVALDHALTSQIDMSVASFGARTRDADPGIANPFMQLAAVEPNVSPDSAMFGNPYYALDVSDRASRRDRSGWSVGGEYRPLSWLFVRATTSRDKARYSSSTAYPPSGPDEITRFTAGTQRQSVTHATLGARRSFRQDVVRTSARFTFADETYRITGEDGFALVPRPGSPFPPSTNVSSFMRRDRSQSYSFAATTDIGDRISLDAHLRKDQAGWLVPTRAGMWFHRLSGAYTLGSTKLHLAQGTAAPRVMNTVQSAPLALCPIGYPVLGPGLGSACGGSPTRMPHARELEVGVSHRFRERYDVGYTIARQRTTDVLFIVPVPQPSTLTTDLDNVGTTVGLTHELSAAARVLSAPGLSWDVNVSAHRVRVKMRDMTRSEVRLFGNAGQLPFFLRNGDVVGTMYGFSHIRTEAQLLGTLQTGQLTGTVADYLVNEEGYYVRAADWRTPNERPLTYYACTSAAPVSGTCQSSDPFVKIGDANPDVDLGINTTLRWNALTMYATVNGIFGGNIWNGSRGFAFRAGRDPVFDQSARPAAERKPMAYYGAFANPLDEFFVESGTFVKLSELAVDWRLPIRQDTRVGIVGRNLFVGSSYSGYDPDAAAGEPSMFGFRVDGTGHPAYRTVALRVQLGR